MHECIIDGTCEQGDRRVRRNLCYTVRRRTSSLITESSFLRLFMAELKFSVDSALLSELGEKLVESPHIALVELVKNAYDADATRVAVRIVANSLGGTDVRVS